MKFSVLIPVYSKENPQYFYEALQSIVNQTKKPNEIVIVKDGKLTDELEIVIEKIQKENVDIEFNVIEIPDHKGTGFALNLGIKNCKYDYVARMDSDDVSLFDRFEKQIDYIENHPDIDILSGQVEEFDETLNKKISLKYMPVDPKKINKFIKYRCPINHVAVMYKKDSILKIGNYDPEKLMEDYDLWIRGKYYNLKMHNLNIVLVRVRINDEMYKRRSGLKYVNGIIQIENELYKLGFINRVVKNINIFCRVVVAMLPNKIRKFIYVNFLRNN